MPVTVTETIGSAGGRDFSTIQAWEDALPSDLVSADEVRVGACQNDSEFLSTSFNGLIVSISGLTTDATRYPHLTAAVGESFQDHANVRTTALAYEQSQGVGLRVTGNYATVIDINTQDDVHVSRLQIKSDHATSNNCLDHRGTCVGTRLNDLLIHGAGKCLDFAFASRAVNCLLIHDADGGECANDFGFAGNQNEYIHCTFVKPVDRTSTGSVGSRTQYANDTTLYRSCAFFGFATPVQNGGSASSHNATDVASGLPGSNNQHSVTYSQTTPFTDADRDSLDLRPVASTALDGTGVLDGTNAPADITGTARADPPTIGVWELVAAGGGISIPVVMHHRMRTFGS